MVRTSPTESKRRSSARGNDTHAESNAADPQQSSTEVVVDHITTGILAGRYVPGQRLIEADLTHTLQISRGPVREAFRRLDALGLVSGEMHRGACVRTLTRTEALDLLLAAEPLVGLIARLAAVEVKARSRPRETTLLAHELRAYRDRKYDLLNKPGARQLFQEILLKLSGNSQMPSVFPTMRIHLLRMQVQSFRDVGESRANLDDFAAMAKAVLDGDGKAAERTNVGHHRQMIRAVEEMPDAAFPRVPEN
jgi:DNA-binding GntR family transcriptional regulator